MRYRIRPHHLFQLVETENYAERLVQFVLPDSRSPMLLETSLLVALSKALGAQRLFEFGTLFGVQTLNLAANLPDDGHVWTLDLDAEAFATADQCEADRDISRRHLDAVDQLAFAHPDYRDMVTRLLGDSNLFDFSPYYGSMQMVYVDGGHDARTMASDSDNAFKLLDSQKPAAVAWHDDANPTYPDVSTHLDLLAKERDLFHIEGTMLCVAFNSAATALAEHLRSQARV